MNTDRYWPLGLFAVAGFVLVAGTLALSWVLGQRHAERATSVPFESGVPPTGSARLRFFAEFYLFAMLAVVFDLESVYLFAWAVAVRDLGWAGFAVAALFVGVLLAALAYLWRAGALHLEISGHTPAPAEPERQVRHAAARR